ncbi:uncharacterized protein N7496_008459 [Penicillium cataractarum]|uniref:Uncharacterized protein n=1 Tax=Penicillium cataractarum TaxID=2100454 RepID=A0A9W9S0A7_9EURO|nr:uncharacterized protein N7496_008459 [Penicillium cataractarum]KAJ5368699.1 hypothetical protein N7496_008459 [Penicillium cataractarum]
MAHAKPSPDLLVAFQKEFRRPVEAAEKKSPRLRIILELDGAPEVRVLFLRTDPVANNHPAVLPLVCEGRWLYLLPTVLTGSDGPDACILRTQSEAVHFRPIPFMAYFLKSEL